MKALRTILERLEAAWYVLTARSVMCVRMKRRVAPDEVKLANYWFGDWQPWELNAAGGTTAQARDEEMAEQLVKELLR